MQVNLRVLAELNASEMTRIASARITTRDFLSSLNRAVPYVHNLVIIIIITNPKAPKLVEKLLSFI